MANASAVPAVLEPTETPEIISNTSYSLSMMFSSSQAQQAMVAVSPVSTLVTDLDRCVNQQFYLATAENFFGSTMMFVSCDSNQTETTMFMDELLGSGASCVVFYSEHTSGCTFDPAANPKYRKIPNLFTMLSAGASMQILSLLNTKTIVSATIASQSSSSHDGGSSNSLIALYVIVALVGFVLLAIVFVGAVRLNRNPERYGVPPAAELGYRPPGQVYASRARGLARAVLDSIPLVRVAEPESKPSVKEADIEGPSNSVRNSMVEGDHFYDASSGFSRADKPANATGVVEQPETGSTDAVHPETADDDLAPVLHIRVPEYAPQDAKIQDAYISQEHDLCPICFEKFFKDEILRALPCNHRFHADCVDPWLMNESSECPLCRIDLALVNDPSQEPTEPTRNPRFRGRFTQSWRKLVRSRRQRLDR